MLICDFTGHNCFKLLFIKGLHLMFSHDQKGRRDPLHHSVNLACVKVEVLPVGSAQMILMNISIGEVICPLHFIIMMSPVHQTILVE